MKASIFVIGSTDTPYSSAFVTTTLSLPPSSFRTSHSLQYSTNDNSVTSFGKTSASRSGTNRGWMTTTTTQRSATTSASTDIGNDVMGAKQALLLADCVCFDVDSTVIQEEGYDELAEYLGKGSAVQVLTKQTMEGGIPFQDALKGRLDLIQPSKQQIERFLTEHPFKLTPGVQEFIQTLKEHKKDVYLVSGGLRIMIEPIASQLNIPIDDITANTILFDMDGLYEGFDTTEPTSRDMGKSRAISDIINKHQYRCVVMIGDGMTDTQAKPPAQAFIGFGGVVVREAVKNKSDWFVTDFNDLIQHLKSSKPSSSV
jgi:phosphoserine phosphatase